MRGQNHCRNIAETIKMGALVEQVALGIAILVTVVTKKTLDDVVRRIACLFGVDIGE
jgi:hypothetical protein